MDLCSDDPGFEVDLFVSGSLRAMTSIWMGVTTVKKEVEASELERAGRQGNCQRHAGVAGPQPLRQGEKPPGGVNARYPSSVIPAAPDVRHVQGRGAEWPARLQVSLARENKALMRNL